MTGRKLVIHSRILLKRQYLATDSIYQGIDLLKEVFFYFSATYCNICKACYLLRFHM